MAGEGDYEYPVLVRPVAKSDEPIVLEIVAVGKGSATGYLHGGFLDTASDADLERMVEHARAAGLRCELTKAAFDVNGTHVPAGVIVVQRDAQPVIDRPQVVEPPQPSDQLERLISAIEKIAAREPQPVNVTVPPDVHHHHVEVAVPTVQPPPLHAHIRVEQPQPRAVRVEQTRGGGRRYIPE